MVGDVTDPFMTGNFCNYAADVRGNPVGFDVRHKNGFDYAQIAVKTGKLTTMPKVTYNEDTHNFGFDLEAKAQLDKNVSLRAQNRTVEGKKSSQAAMLVYQKKF